jgi:hypothetical protein
MIFIDQRAIQVENHGFHAPEPDALSTRRVKLGSVLLYRRCRRCRWERSPRENALEDAVLQRRDRATA